MKSIFSLALIAAISFTSCKTDIAEVVEVSTAIVGTWELRQTSAAMMPTPTSYAAGNGTILKFLNGTYKSYDKGVLVKSGTYTIVQDSTFEESVCMVRPEGQFKHRVIYDGDTAATKQFIQLMGNKLIFMSGCYAVDAGSSVQYEKISNTGD